jgi:hypothetical protein
MLPVVPSSWSSLLSHYASPHRGDLEGLRCCLRRSMNYNWHTRVQSLLTNSCPILSHCIGQRGLRQPFQKLQGPPGVVIHSVVDHSVPGGPDPLWRTPPLSSETILCQSDHGDYVSSWWSCYVRQWWDGFPYSSACCQVRLDTCGCLWLCAIFFGSKWPRYLRISALGTLVRYWQPLGMATRGLGVCQTGARGGVRLGW